MSIANELSAEIAIALLTNRDGDLAELLRLAEICHTELRRLSLNDSSSSDEQHFNEGPKNPGEVTMRGAEYTNCPGLMDALNVELSSSSSKTAQRSHG
jgi:hypothetical protein